MYTSSKTGAYIGHAITNKYRVVHINAQFITRLQQHARTGLATDAILIFSMWAVVNLLYPTAYFVDTSYHPSMNFLNSFYRYAAMSYRCLICTNNDAMTSP